MKKLIVALAACGLAAAPLYAQNTLPAPGARVRLQTEGESVPRIFILKEVVADTLVLDGLSGGTLASTRIATGSISRLQVSDGHRSAGSRVLRGGGLGFAGGGIFGALIGLSSGDDDGTFFAFTAEEKAVLSGVVLGAAGFVVGAIVGLASNPEQWRTVAPEHITISPTNRGGLVVGYRYRL
jgi:hypothetical protein